jgi:uncharacterized repeat protein (TIGR03803 family)
MKGISTVLVAFALACAVHCPAAEASTEKVLYSFGTSNTDGEHPYAGLIDVEGTLYGTTYNGGTYSIGTVFSLNRETDAEKVLHSFGTSSTSNTDGEYPAGLIDVKGTLYGTTYYGGTYRDGTVFSLNPETDVETVLHSFGTSNRDGEYPYAGLIDVKGTLYGTTKRGGTYADGTVFSLNPETDAEKVLHSFGPSSAGGEHPYAGLVDVEGTLYGTTFYGGTYGDGTVFSVNAKTHAETVLYSFGTSNTDGEYPLAGLIDIEGTLYGTTYYGGTHGEGTVFALDSKTGAETVLYSFCSQKNCTDGAYPQAGLIDVEGTLYGTTYYGGTYGEGATGEGTVFSLNPETNAEKVLHSFGASNPVHRDGEYPHAGLIDVEGTLYGTTFYGGTYGCGTVFSITR